MLGKRKMPLDASSTHFFLLMLGLLAGLQSASAIKCYVCAPVAEIGQTCSSVTEADAEQCEPRHDACHVLFIQEKSGQTEIIRNCGKYKGAFAAGNNECKDFQTVNGKVTRICNCQTNQCNDQNLPSSMTTVASVVGGGVIFPVKPTDPNRLPQPALGGSTPSSGVAALLMMPASLILVLVLFLSV